MTVLRKHALSDMFHNKALCLSMVGAELIPLCRSYSLTEKELAFVRSNSSLSDSVMNIVRYLTRKTFPHWGGFQAVLLAEGLKFTGERCFHLAIAYKSPRPLAVM